MLVQLPLDEFRVDVLGIFNEQFNLVESPLFEMPEKSRVPIRERRNKKDRVDAEFHLMIFLAEGADDISLNDGSGRFAR